jgi:beta-lactamase regulating signal transducer with metallopeptidase domain
VWETSLRAGLGNAAVAAALAVVVGCVGPLLRRRPALRHGLWLLVLIKLVTPPVWVVPVAWLAAPGDARSGRVVFHKVSGAAPDETALIADGEAGVIEVVVEPAVPPEPAPRAADPGPAAPPAASSWWTIVAWTWIDGTLLTFGIAVARVARFRKLLGLGRPAPAGVVAQVEALSARLGLARPPEVWWMPGAVSPMLWAAGGRPLLVVPADLWKRLDDRQRVTLLVHELAHLRRRDHWVRGLELLATGLYWWHPAVWWARHELREAEEQCCDAWVVWACPDAARTYAETLLEAVDFLSGPAPAVPSLASGLGQAQHLKRRLTMILRGTTHRTLNRTGALAVLGLSALMLPLSPTWAQKADDKEVEIEVVAPEVRIDEKTPTATEEQRQRMKATIDALAEQIRALDRGARGEAEEEFRIADQLVRMTLKTLPDLPGSDDEDDDEKDKDKDKPKPRASKEQLEKRKAEQLEKRKAMKEKLAEDAGRRKEDQDRAREAREEIEKLRKEEREARAVHEKALARLLEAQAKLMVTDGMRGFSWRGPIPPAAPFAAKPLAPEPRKPAERPTRTYTVVRPGSPEVFAHRAPDQDRRIDELEKKLDELIGVVKGLKAERDEKGSKRE